MASLGQSMAQARHDQPARQAPIAKPHLRFCRMHVDIHLMRIAIQEQGHCRMPVARQKIRIRPPQRTYQQLVAHWSTVDKEILLDRRAARIGGQCGISGHMQPLAFGINAQRIFSKLTAQNPGQTAMQRVKHITGFRIGAKCDTPAVTARHIGQGKAGKRLSHRQTLDHIADGLGLGAIRAHKFQTCRGGVKQIAQFHHGACVQRRRAHRCDFARIHGDLRRRLPMHP